jgi:hypothetical protein
MAGSTTVAVDAVNVLDAPPSLETRDSREPAAELLCCPGIGGGNLRSAVLSSSVAFAAGSSNEPGAETPFERGGRRGACETPDAWVTPSVAEGCMRGGSGGPVATTGEANVELLPDLEGNFGGVIDN